MDDKKDYVDAEQAAHEVSEANNNPDMKGLLRLYLRVVERQGFRIVRADNAQPDPSYYEGCTCQVSSGEGAWNEAHDPSCAREQGTDNAQRPSDG